MILLLFSVAVLLLAACHPRWSWWPLAMVPWALWGLWVELHSLPFGAVAELVVGVALVPTAALWGLACWWRSRCRPMEWRVHERRAITELTLGTALAVAVFSVAQSVRRPPVALFEQGEPTYPGQLAFDPSDSSDSSAPRVTASRSRLFSLRVQRAGEAFALSIESRGRSSLLGTYSRWGLRQVSVRSHPRAACVLVSRPKCSSEALCFDRWQSRGQLGAVAHHFAPPWPWLAMSLLALALALYARVCQRAARVRWALSSAMLCSLPGAGYLIACAINQVPWR